MNELVDQVMDIEEAAGYWDARLRAPDCTHAERLAHEEWKKADPSHARAFESLQTIIEELPSIASMPEIQSMRAAALSRANEESLNHSNPTHWRLIGGSLAASFLVIIFSSILFFSFDIPYGNNTDTDNLQTPVFATIVGERIDVPLSDGTQATLNTDSKIDVKYNSEERAIRLVKGEAHFDVTHNPDKPFIVYTDRHKVTAVGTAFDVKLIGDAFEVTVTEGKVAVTRLYSDGTEAEQSKEMLLAGQQYSANAGGPAIRRKTDVATASSWRNGNAVFDDTPLIFAIQEMNRYSEVKLTIKDPKLANAKINGMFITGKQDSFIEALETYFSAQAKYVNDNEILLEPLAK